MTHGDGIDYLADKPDDLPRGDLRGAGDRASPYERLLDFLRLTATKLKPDGLLIAETVNPHPLQRIQGVLGRPTHEQPIFPELAVMLCRLTDSDRARVMFPTGAATRARPTGAGRYGVRRSRGMS